MSTIPVIDLHCDLTVYLLEREDASFTNGEAIGCALPHLQKGGVIKQVCAFFTPHDPIYHKFAWRQSQVLKRLDDKYDEVYASAKSRDEDKIHLLPAIENASGICHEDEKLADGLENLQRLFDEWGTLFYIGFMHMFDNRFGGAAGSTKGLTDDGRVLLDWLDGKGCAVDLAHASDQAGRDTFDYVAKKGLDIRILASHSNMRPVYNHKRNLPEDLVEILVEHKSPIGVNFMKDYLNPDKPDVIYDHIEYALSKGSENCLAFGADYFNDSSGRGQIYHLQHADASCYPDIIANIVRIFGKEIAEKVAWKNAAAFIDNQ